MKVTIDIPDRPYWLLGGNAERAGRKIDEIVQEGVNIALGSAIKQLRSNHERQQQIISLALGGETNAVIRERTGESAQYVYSVLSAAGIKSNKQPRSETEVPK